MSYAVNYPQYGMAMPQYGMMPPAYPASFDWMLVLYISVGIFLCVVLIYCVWAYQVNRYSSSRIAGKLLTKFKAKNKLIDPPKYVEDDHNELAIELATLTADKASANVLFRDKETHKATDSTLFIVTNKDTCSPLDNTCIRL